MTPKKPRKSDGAVSPNSNAFNPSMIVKNAKLASKFIQNFILITGKKKHVFKSSVKSRKSLESGNNSPLP